ncbi:MAG TPA: S8 family serine peptidase [Mycobacteriales bacterium]|jgi:subtilase family serine protease|nr:S8 family serine peptidase [Mycobacteriales bacterium]
MRRTLLRALPALLALATTAPAGALTLPVPVPALAVTPACGTALTPAVARCHALRVTSAEPLGGSGPGGGYSPNDLKAAYALDPTRGAGHTIAIVDAYDNPNADADLATYRAQFGLPACTIANGCFTQVEQRGVPLTAQTRALGFAPPGDVGWGQEIALDVDMASAICPLCKILLVEADSASILDLAQAVQTAVALGATEVSNSYGAPEFNGELDVEAAYTHPGIVITASSGDSGYGVQYPAAAAGVVAVGGTRLVQAATTPRGWSETVWNGAGSGCSLYVPKPVWQQDTGCANRTVADVSAVADPGTGVSVYDTYGSGGWLVFGGTSVSAPIIAGVYALNGHTASPPVPPAAWLYRSTGGLNDVTSGSNGACSPSYLCTGVPGYDGPTGLGTPKGSVAFGPA